MSFGLRNAAQSFQRFIDEVTSGLEYCFAYIDDILVASVDEQEHIVHLRQLFQRFASYGVVLNHEKCCFGKPNLRFLGYAVDSAGIQPPPERVEAITNMAPPSTIKALRRFLGMINFYRRFLPKAADIQAPLTALLGGPKKNDNKAIEWNKDLLDAFQSINRSLKNAALLAHPDSLAPLSLMVDASDVAIGAVLQQQIAGNWNPCPSSPLNLQALSRNTVRMIESFSPHIWP